MCALIPPDEPHSFSATKPSRTSAPMVANFETPEMSARQLDDALAMEEITAVPMLFNESCEGAPPAKPRRFINSLVQPRAKAEAHVAPGKSPVRSNTKLATAKEQLNMAGLICGFVTPAAAIK